MKWCFFKHENTSDGSYLNNKNKSGFKWLCNTCGSNNILFGWTGGINDSCYKTRCILGLSHSVIYKLIQLFLFSELQGANLKSLELG